MHIREHLSSCLLRHLAGEAHDRSSSLCKKWLIIILVEFGLVAFTITCVIYMSDNSSNVGDMCMIGVSSVPSHEWCINDDSEMALSLTRQRQTLALYMYIKVVIMMRTFEGNEWVRAHFMDRLHICISKRSHRWGNLQKSLWYRAGCIFTLSFLFYLGTEGETWMVWSLFILKLKLRQIFGRGKKWMVDQGEVGAVLQHQHFCQGSTTSQQLIFAMICF